MPAQTNQSCLEYALRNLLSGNEYQICVKVTSVDLTLSCNGNICQVNQCNQGQNGGMYCVIKEILRRLGGYGKLASANPNVLKSKFEKIIDAVNAKEPKGFIEQFNESIADNLRNGCIKVSLNNGNINVSFQNDCQHLRNVPEDALRGFFQGVQGNSDINERRRILTDILPKDIAGKLVDAIREVAGNDDMKKACVATLLAAAYCDLLTGDRKAIAMAEVVVGAFRAKAFSSNNNVYLPFCPSRRDIATLIWLAVFWCKQAAGQATGGGGQ